MVSAAQNANAARVNVGFAVALVGNTPLPTRNKFLQSQLRCLQSTTELLFAVPMRYVPMMCPAPMINGLQSSGLDLHFFGCVASFE